ncbi:12139_t:CDS:2, partial [Racocetra fulgida]
MQNNNITENDAFKVILDDSESWKWVCFDEYRCRGKLERQHCQIVREIDRFNGEVSFSDLPVVPIELSTAQDFLKENIIANGKQFFNFASGHHFMSYEGPLLRERCMWVEKVRADGRIMIDLQSFATMNPEYSMGNAKPPNKCDIKMLNEKNTYIKLNELHQDSNYFLAPAVVYGFSFTIKEWGLFEISKVSDIIFDSDSLDQVVMPQNKKQMLEGLVSQYANPNQNTNSDGFVNATSLFEKSLDPITNKEKELVKILDIAHIWKAVILLDEADIYLEKRSTIDLTRNTLVGIFLRERQQVWTNFIKRASLPLNANDFINYELNGREIRNVLHTARLLAKNEGKDLTSDTVIDVIKVIQEFRQ